jgi:hypothetical protein
MIDEGRASFADLTRPTPFRAQVHPIRISLTHFSTKPDVKNPYSFTARMGPDTIVSWSSNFSVLPLRAGARSRSLGHTSNNSFLTMAIGFAAD